MRILYLAHRIPFPPNKGDKIRSFNEIKYLSENNEIHLACLADDPNDVNHEEELRKYCKSVSIVLINPFLAKLKSLLFLFTRQPLSVPYFYSAKMQRAIDATIASIDIDVILCFSSQTAEYVFKSKEMNHQLAKASALANGKNKKQIKLVMDFVDVDSDKWEQYSKYSRFPLSLIYSLESKRLAKYERKIAKIFDMVSFISEHEAKLFKDKNPHINNIVIIPNGVDTDYFNSATVKESAIFPENKSSQNRINEAQQMSLVFLGMMDYFANIDGVLWFANEIFPLIQKEVKNIRFYIVGGNPSQKIKNLEEKNKIIVTGYVKDVRDYLNESTVFIVPLRIARGIQNKILEAMAAGVPIVSTPQAFQGIQGEPGQDLIVTECPQEFANQVVNLIKDEKKREFLRKNAMKLISEKYSWKTNLQTLDQTINDVAV